MKILRVFPKRNSYTPTDSMTAFGLPKSKEFIPEHDEVHISCVFSWNKTTCLNLQANWQDTTDKPVLIGGPAFRSPATDFRQGMYMRPDYVLALAS